MSTPAPKRIGRPTTIGWFALRKLPPSAGATLPSAATASCFASMLPELVASEDAQVRRLAFQLAEPSALTVATTERSPQRRLCERPRLRLIRLSTPLRN